MLKIRLAIFLAKRLLLSRSVSGEIVKEGPIGQVTANSPAPPEFRHCVDQRMIVPTHRIDFDCILRLSEAETLLASFFLLPPSIADKLQTTSLLIWHQGERGTVNSWGCSPGRRILHAVPVLRFKICPSME
jgi:hypothetical protein